MPINRTPLLWIRLVRFERTQTSLVDDGVWCDYCNRHSVDIIVRERVTHKIINCQKGMLDLRLACVDRSLGEDVW